MMLISQTALRARFAVALLLAVGCVSTGFIAPRVALGSVSSIGNVAPAVPIGGGSVLTPLLVGDTLPGVLTINGGTQLTVANGGSATLGNAASGIGIATLNGMGSDLTVGNDLVIGNAGAGSVSSANIARITIADDLLMGIAADSSGELTVTDLGTIVNVTDTVNCGALGTAVIEISNGGRLLADDTVIGTSAGAMGRVSLTGLHSLWQQTNSMTVGDIGRGTLEIFDQARVVNTNVVVGNAFGSNGTVEVNGAGSVWDITGFVNTGVSGIASIDVLNGGRVTNTGTLRLATLSNGEAHVTVSGKNSVFAVGTTANIGEFGLGIFQVLNGGRVTSQGVTIGDNIGSRGAVTVDGENSVWQITGTLDISDPAEASLTVSHGGSLTVTGLVSVRAAGTLAFSGGRINLGTVTGITNQGLVSGGGTINGSITNTVSGEIRIGSGDHMLINSNITNAGLVTFDGGELEVLGTATNSLDIDVRNATLRFQSGLSNNSGGALAIVGGDVDVFGNVISAAGAQVVVGGQSIAVFHDTFTNNGALLVTPGSELLTLENLSFAAAASSLSIQIAGDDPIEGFGRVHAAGAAALMGTLNVALVEGFSPELGDSFTVLTSLAGVSGTFGTQSLPALGAGLAWDVDYNANSLVLSVIGTSLLGDYNNNGVVDAADYIVYRKTFGQTGTGLAADGNHNNQIDVGDYAVWQAHFGNIAGSGLGLGSNAAVPEPTVLGLLSVSLLIMVGKRRRAT